MILNKIRYAIPAWSGFFSVHLVSQISGLLKRCYKYGYCLKINTVEDVIESMNHLITNVLEAYKINNIASTLFCLQPSHLTMTLDLKDTIIRYLITPQNCINNLSHPILCSSITNFSCVIILFFVRFVCACVCFCVIYSVILLHLMLCSFINCMHARLLHVY